MKSIFATRSKEKMKEIKMTQQQLADKIGLTLNGLKRYYRDEASLPSLDLAKQIANVLEVDVSYLIGEQYLETSKECSIYDLTGLEGITAKKLSKLSQKAKDGLEAFFSNGNAEFFLEKLADYEGFPAYSDIKNISTECTNEYIQEETNRELELRVLADNIINHVGHTPARHEIMFAVWEIEKNFRILLQEIYYCTQNNWKEDFDPCDSYKKISTCFLKLSSLINYIREREIKADISESNFPESFISGLTYISKDFYETIKNTH